MWSEGKYEFEQTAYTQIPMQLNGYIDRNSGYLPQGSLSVTFFRVVILERVAL
jgi:hypothetical protein